MACLGGDGVILHASNLFRDAVPPVVSFNLGSLGFLTSHTVSLWLNSFFLMLLFYFINLVIYLTAYVFVFVFLILFFVYDTVCRLQAGLTAGHPWE